MDVQVYSTREEKKQACVEFLNRCWDPFKLGDYYILKDGKEGPQVIDAYEHLVKHLTLRDVIDDSDSVILFLKKGVLQNVKAVEVKY